MDKDKLILQANEYMAGDSDVKHDGADFWLWRNANRKECIDFIVELSSEEVTCMDSEELWHMAPSSAETSKVIDTTEGYCPECPYTSRCSKVMDATEIQTEATSEDVIMEDTQPIITDTHEGS